MNAPNPTFTPSADAFARSKLVRACDPEPPRPAWSDNVIAALAADGWQPALDGVLVSVQDEDGAMIAVPCQPLTGEFAAAQIWALSDQARQEPENEPVLKHRAYAWMRWALKHGARLPSLTNRPGSSQPPVEPYPQPLPEPKPESKPEQYRKEISWNGSDYNLYLDGDLVGCARTYYEGEVTLNEVIHSLLSRAA